MEDKARIGLLFAEVSKDNAVGQNNNANQMRRQNIHKNIQTDACNRGGGRRPSPEKKKVKKAKEKERKNNLTSRVL